MMERIVTYTEFLNNKNNIKKYLDTLFSSVPNIIVYFPKNLTKEERHLIYVNSKGYFFEKLSQSVDYSIKMWRVTKNELSNLNYTTYEKKLTEQINKFDELEKDIEKIKRELKYIKYIYNISGFLSGFCFVMLCCEYLVKSYNFDEFKSLDYNFSLETSSYHF